MIEGSLDGHGQRVIGVLGCELPYHVQVQARVYEAIAMLLERMPKTLFSLLNMVDVIECHVLRTSAIRDACFMLISEVVIPIVMPSRPGNSAQSMASIPSNTHKTYCNHS